MTFTPTMSACKCLTRTESLRRFTICTVANILLAQRELFDFWGFCSIIVLQYEAQLLL